MYYVDGNFISREGIAPESFSLHPQGVPHGPHPGTYEKSIGVKRTEELAVMCDRYKLFQLTSQGEALSEKSYNESWVE